MKTTATLCFRVNFEGMTRNVRDFWAERKYAYALEVVRDGFNQTEERALRILAGELKMIDAPGGREGIDGTLAPDNWKPEKGLFYPNPTLGIAYAEAALGRHIAEVENRSLREQLEGITEAEIRKERDEKRVAEFVAKERDKDRRTEQKQVPDRTLKADYGWLLPDGKFYACKSVMEHIWLASVLREQTTGNAERDAEKGGWIKIGKSGNDVYVFVERAPTQRQIDTLFDWSHKKPSRKRAFDDFMERWGG